MHGIRSVGISCKTQPSGTISLLSPLLLICYVLVRDLDIWLMLVAVQLTFFEDLAVQLTLFKDLAVICSVCRMQIGAC